MMIRMMIGCGLFALACGMAQIMRAQDLNQELLFNSLIMAPENITVSDETRIPNLLTCSLDQAGMGIEAKYLSAIGGTLGDSLNESPEAAIGITAAFSTNGPCQGATLEVLQGAGFARVTGLIDAPTTGWLGRRKFVGAFDPNYSAITRNLTLIMTIPGNPPFDAIFEQRARCVYDISFGTVNPREIPRDGATIQLEPRVSPLCSLGPIVVLDPSFVHLDPTTNLLTIDPMPSGQPWRLNALALGQYQFPIIQGDFVTNPVPTAPTTQAPIEHPKNRFKFRTKSAGIGVRG